MDVAITSFQPDPISTHSGELVMLKVGVFADRSVDGAHLVVHNNDQDKAILFDSDEESDTVRSAPRDLRIGSNDVTHEIGLHLPASHRPGVVAGVSVQITDSDGSAVSKEFNLLATVKQ